MGYLDKLGAEARKHNGRKDWALEAVKAPNDPRISKYKFPAGSPKCNLFVCDMLYNVGITPPLGSDSKWPLTAEDWQSSVDNFKIVTAMQRGDILSTGTHMGIAMDSKFTVAAGQNKIYTEVASKDLDDATIQRYGGLGA